jgi:predicted transcriptional regulator
MNVSLKPELETRIAEEVKAGRSADPGEFLNKAVYHYLVARDLGLEYTPEEMDAMISAGLNDIDRGDTVEGEEAFRLLRAASAQRHLRQP